MDTYDLSYKLLDAWRTLVMSSNDPGSINKSSQPIYTCVIIDDSGKRRVIGCHIEGPEVILDLESKNG